ncbi:hypothetical protein L7F22_016689 [Adiantum nelumboides]|nr:hypothetical protein [Adiantum nelumboides]
MEKMGEKLSATIKGKQVVGMQEVALDPMTHTQSMKMVMEELFQSRQQEEHVEVESNDSELESYQGSGDTAMAAFDPNEEETKVWLKRIGLYEFTCLPWDAWVENEFTEQQWNMIKEGKGLIAGDVRLTPKWVSKVFKIPYLSVPAKGRKVIDSQMKGEFGYPIGAKSYYMVWNAGGIRAANLFWYLEKVCILQKTAYMSKEAFVPLYQAERGVKVDWATISYNWMQLTASSMKAPATDMLMEEGTVSGKGEMEKINMQLLQEKLDREKLQEEVARLQAKGKAMTSEILSVVEDFQQWVDGLKTAVDEQFKELDEKESVKRENEVLKIENERLIAEMEEMRNNRKEIEDSLSKLKAELHSGFLEPDWNLAAEVELDVEKQADPDFVVEMAMELDVEGDIGE